MIQASSQSQSSSSFAIKHIVRVIHALLQTCYYQSAGEETYSDQFVENVNVMFVVDRRIQTPTYHV